ncbi:hypothetical protein QE441_003102 [Chryseobacterium sp. SORGH_AS909]|uniref:Uncharacterized protein n=1 Tax=Chryseobacterium camelliae TaxID=1265445 RepID=A0ABU0TG39_9FLAO|nr:hypothetical protein [Chryseobacterium camelliae]MDQ1099962.1 hypothetical protein [Chryseobacterium sp. SORGH_AS_1048]MDR6087308.1 hypothetical protein [Chryseobacterium sp. SORGH_AS_0909]MDR6131682.1 hypothetical protein [Chryseobacterium sp. SORGH_AS_1175]MDT3406172.1 hypothetical protein [Pseudacidovorax intermedius]
MYEPLNLMYGKNLILLDEKMNQYNRIKIDLKAYVKQKTVHMNGFFSISSGISPRTDPVPKADAGYFLWQHNHALLLVTTPFLPVHPGF